MHISIFIYVRLHIYFFVLPLSFMSKFDRIHLLGRLLNEILLESVIFHKRMMQRQFSGCLLIYIRLTRGATHFVVDYR